MPSGKKKKKKNTAYNTHNDYWPKTGKQVTKPTVASKPYQTNF